ncbi:sensor histidine kinase [Streptomyces chitinivorans]|uniref:Sensor histidine kinase n=1 Tax=Streptomyces chitinivorans TaxID=1257027 RepID=A0ABW7HSK2_9ACTN|nr:sensor histidine kinase [Streptomyces chitinivorans]MDH2410987.1 sensor histidine kinase [Streptomyces chitinivorans]
MTRSEHILAERGSSDPFVHPALFYRSPGEYLTGVGGFVDGALEAGDPVLVAVPGPRLGMLREHLGDATAADRLTLVDMAEFGRNPGRILSGLRDFADRHPGRTARIVGEPIWARRSPAELVEATRHEALINAAFTGRAATVLCPYDASRLPARVCADARRTHPVLWEDGGERPSAHYTAPRALSAECDALPLAPPPAHTRTLAFTTGDLGEVRHHADTWAEETGLGMPRRGDFVLAVAEAAANSIAHGGGRGILRLWSDGPARVAEIRDGGHLTDPLAGRRRPALDCADGGRGLWMMHQLCDLVETRSTSAGLTVRLHMDHS